jgi:hypothetical protein
MFTGKHSERKRSSPNSADTSAAVNQSAGSYMADNSPPHSGMSSSKQPDIIFFANFFHPKYQFQSM